MQASEEKIITRELKVILTSVAGMLYIAGLSNPEICDLVRTATYVAAEETRVNAPTTKDKGGD